MRLRLPPLTAETALELGYGVVPILAGADKFTHFLVDWDKYLSPAARRFLPIRPSTFMRLVGVVEIAVGLGVLFKPTRRFASWVAGSWLMAITAQLLAGRAHYDVAARDALLAMGALALAAREGKQPEIAVKPPNRERPGKRVGPPRLQALPQTQPTPKLAH